MRAGFLIPPIAFLAALTAGGSSIAPHGRPFIFNYENVLGTSLELKIGARNSAAADRADAAARREIEREARILSAWDSASEFSRWVATLGEAVRVSPELFETLFLFDEWRERTDGALDASAEIVVRVWKNAEREGREPSRAELDAAVNGVRHPHWKLDRVAQTATHLDRAPIALNSFAKSYIAGHAADAALAVSSVSSVVVNIGGDLVVRGPRSELVDIADPRCDAENCAPLAQVEIQSRAVATSGNYRRSFDITGRHRCLGHCLLCAHARRIPARRGIHPRSGLSDRHQHWRTHRQRGLEQARLAPADSPARRVSPRSRGPRGSCRVGPVAFAHRHRRSGATRRPRPPALSCDLGGRRLQNAGTNHRALVQQGPLPAGNARVVPHRSGEPNKGYIQLRAFHRQRHALSGKIQLQLGRQGRCR